MTTADRRPLTATLLTVLCLATIAGCATLELRVPLGEPIAPVAPPPPLERAWRIDADAAFGPDTPTVTDDGEVVVATRDGVVFVVNAADGTRAGRGRFGDAIEGRIAFDGPRVYVPLARAQGGVVGANATGGNLLWTLREGPHLAGLRLVEGVLVAAAHDGTVRGLDPLTGDVRWAHRPDSLAQFRGTPADLGDGRVAVADTRGVVHAIDVSSGRILWRADAGAPVYRSAEASGGLLAVPTTRGTLVAFDATTGATRWTVRAAPGVRMATPALADGLVVVGGTDGVLRAHDAQTGAERWTREVDGTLSATPLLADGALYVGTGRKRLIALDPASGEITWETELSGRVKSGLTAVGGTLVVLAEPRFIYGFRPAAVASR